MSEALRILTNPSLRQRVGSLTAEVQMRAGLLLRGTTRTGFEGAPLDAMLEHLTHLVEELERRGQLEQSP